MRRITVLTVWMVAAGMSASTSSVDVQRSTDRTAELLKACATASEAEGMRACETIVDERLLDLGVPIPPTIEFYRRVGAVFKTRAERDRLIRLYRDGVEALPGNSEIPFRLASELFEWLGACHEAYGVALEALRRDPKDAKIHVLLGGIALCRGQKEEALGYFERALAIEPSDSVRLNLGVSLAALGRHREAVQALQSVQNPSAIDDGYRHILLARSFTQMGEMKAAVSEFTAAATAPAWRDETYCGLARAWSALGESDKARAGCREAAKPTEHARPRCDCSY
jgi:tetratricopeptide (TPR) repeat protein